MPTGRALWSRTLTRDSASIEILSTDEGNGFVTAFRHGHQLAVWDYLEQQLAPPVAPSVSMRAAHHTGSRFVSVLRLPGGVTTVIAARPLDQTGDNRLGGARTILVEFDEPTRPTYAQAFAIGEACCGFSPSLHAGSLGYGELFAWIDGAIQRSRKRSADHPYPELVERLGDIDSLGAPWYLRISDPLPIGQLADALDEASWATDRGVSLITGEPERSLPLALKLGALIVVDEPHDKAFLARATELTVGLHVRDEWNVQDRVLDDLADLVENVSPQFQVTPTDVMIDGLEHVLQRNRGQAGSASSLRTIERDVDEVVRSYLLDQAQPMPGPERAELHERLVAYGLGPTDGDKPDPWFWLHDGGQVARALIAAAASRGLREVEVRLRWAFVSIGLLGAWTGEVHTLARSGHVCRMAIDAVAESHPVRRKYLDTLDAPVDRYGLASLLRHIDPSFSQVMRFVSALATPDEDAVFRITRSAKELGIPGIETAVAAGLVLAGIKPEHIVRIQETH